MALWKVLTTKGAKLRMLLSRQGHPHWYWESPQGRFHYTGTEEERSGLFGNLLYFGRIAPFTGIKGGSRNITK